MQIAPGCQVEISYVLSLPNGDIVESSEEARPLQFVCGEGQILPALEDAVLGLQEAEEVEFDLSPDQAYGDRNPDAVLAVPRHEIPPDVTLEEGLVYMLKGEEAGERMVMIASVTDSEVILDFNHPLAGETLHFQVKVVSVS
jgi:FKBP-type peptidyl-prolyl cis-trans isomerase 2